MLTGRSCSWKLFFWGRLHRHQCLLEGVVPGSSSSGEGCTDTNTYWKRLLLEALLLGKAAQTLTYWKGLLLEALLLGKAAQTPMLTGRGCSWKLFFWGRLHRHQCLLEGVAPGSSSSGEGCTDTNLLEGVAPGSSSSGEGCTDTNLLEGVAPGSSSSGEGCTDTNTYWKRLLLEALLLGKAAQTLTYWKGLLLEALLLGKAAQTPMLTGRGCSWKLFFWGRLHRHQCLLEGVAPGSSSSGEGCTDTNLLEGVAPGSSSSGEGCTDTNLLEGVAPGSSSSGEGCTDTNTYWKRLLLEALLLGKAAQTLTYWKGLLLEALLLGKAAQTLMLTGRGCSWINFLLYVLLETWTMSRCIVFVCI